MWTCPRCDSQRRFKNSVVCRHCKEELAATNKAWCIKHNGPAAISRMVRRSAVCQVCNARIRRRAYRRNPEKRLSVKRAWYQRRKATKENPRV